MIIKILFRAGIDQ